MCSDPLRIEDLEGWWLQPAFLPARPQDLVGWWNSSSHVGTTWRNLAPSFSGRNHGTLKNGVAIGELLHPSGVFGSGLNFDGVDDYINCGNDPSLNITPQSAYTIEYWAKTTAGQSQGGLHTVGSKIDGQGLIYPGGQLNRPDTDKILLWLKDPTGKDLQVYSTNTIGWNDGNWHHIGVSKASGSAASTVSVFVDGSEIALTISLDENPAAQTYDENTIIGGVDNAGSVLGNFNGTIDEVRIYNLGLQTSEIKHNFFHSPRYYLQHGIEPLGLL